MEKILDYSKLLLPILGTTIAWLFGTWDNSLTILIVFMILDYITGVIKAFIKKEISSAIGLRGIARKSLILIECGWHGVNYTSTTSRSFNST